MYCIERRENFGYSAYLPDVARSPDDRSLHRRRRRSASTSQAVIGTGGLPRSHGKIGFWGIRLFQTEHIDLVIVDYWMSRMNGVAVARALKELRSEIPIIMLSGYAELPDEALGAADAWLIKSHVQPEELLAKVKELLQETSDFDAIFLLMGPLPWPLSSCVLLPGLLWRAHSCFACAVIPHSLNQKGIWTVQLTRSVIVGFAQFVNFRFYPVCLSHFFSLDPEIKFIFLITGLFVPYAVRELLT